MDADRKAEKSSGNTSKTESAVKGAKPSAAVAGGGAPAYTGPDGMLATQPMPMPAPMMPYYGQYAAMYAMPPGAAPVGFPVPPPPNGTAPPMWMPGMVPAPPQGGNPSQSVTGHPYAAPYGAGAQPLMYMPMPYNYPPYVPVPSPTAMGASFTGQPAKPPASGAAPPYGTAAAAAVASLAGTAAAATSAHPHSASAEPAIISPPSIPSPASASAATVAVAPAVPAVTPIEYAVMPLMPNSRLPPGDPFCPAGVAVSSQYAVASLPTRTSTVPDRALTNGIHKPANPTLPTSKTEAPAPPATTAVPTAATTAA